jgi:hypothetical protein
MKIFKQAKSEKKRKEKCGVQKYRIKYNEKILVKLK